MIHRNDIAQDFVLITDFFGTYGLLTRLCNKTSDQEAQRLSSHISPLNKIFILNPKRCSHLCCMTPPPNYQVLTSRPTRRNRGQYL